MLWHCLQRYLCCFTEAGPSLIVSLPHEGHGGFSPNKAWPKNLFANDDFDSVGREDAEDKAADAEDIAEDAKDAEDAEDEAEANGRSALNASSFAAAMITKLSISVSSRLPASSASLSPLKVP